ncbi:carboxylesterase family protein [Aulographum hederae CBS 113979]|uniref:Carboxylic ester hydrolase n=1 Tax=Aulographum hederae CBS 113979 TaxID=1176131 RepID=A0A6G1HE54_9PEZI|nr:carboxylesterase family protein [Aulographum hederae CBS 113979]
MFTPALLLTALSVLCSAQNAYLPVVDLVYELHQALVYDSTGDFYNFSNIRYAAPPVGDLRFREPQPPTENRGEVQTGAQGRICPQASPIWEGVQYQLVVEPVINNGTWDQSEYSLAKAGNALSVLEVSSPDFPQDPRATEDCLFLDVVVPRKAFESAGQSNGSGAPVLVWIYGGGYVNGEKGRFNSGDPAGLLSRSASTQNQDMIYVSLNYRLGAFGWLSGSLIAENGVANAGLYDQRFALEWVQKKIHLFGGDPQHVTVIGESAGGGSIMHQTTAYGGTRGPAPFQRAIPQSPGFFPAASKSLQDRITASFLDYCNVSTIDEARNLPSSDLILANSRQIMHSSYSTYTYGPTVDGVFVPDTPSRLLAAGKFDRNVEVMVGHNGDEGLYFADPFIRTESNLTDFLTLNFPTAPMDVLDFITTSLYPPDYSGRYGYLDIFSRVNLLISELLFTCNNVYLATSKPGNETYSYLFNVSTALHGQDIAYTFFTPATSNLSDDDYGSPIIPKIVDVLQDYIVSFTVSGEPASKVEGIPDLLLYGNNATTQVIQGNGSTGIWSVFRQSELEMTGRCAWWALGLEVPLESGYGGGNGGDDGNGSGSGDGSGGSGGNGTSTPTPNPPQYTGATVALTGSEIGRVWIGFVTVLVGLAVVGL